MVVIHSELLFSLRHTLARMVAYDARGEHTWEMV